MARRQLQWLSTTFVMLCLLAALLAVPRIFLPKMRERKLLSARLDRLEEQVEARQHEISDLKRRQLRFREDPEFVERIARQNRRVRPGEVIFIFESTDTN